MMRNTYLVALPRGGWGAAKAFCLVMMLGLIATSTRGQWSWQEPLPQGNWLNSIFFPTAQSGYVVGASGTIARTTDGGSSWTFGKQNQYTGFNEVYFPNPALGYIVGGSSDGEAPILRTTDAGGEWVALHSGTSRGLSSVHFPTETMGVAVGSWGTILRTTDGGASWLEKSSGVNDDLYSVWFPNVDTGYAVGGSGTVLRTIDGGQTWTVSWRYKSNWLRAVRFFNGRTGVAIGDGGVVCRTTDAGDSWTKIDVGVGGRRLQSLFLQPPSVLFFVGEFGILFKSTDQGATWTGQVSGTRRMLRCIFFGSSVSGLIVGEGGIMLQTGDEGRTWSAISRHNALFLSIKSIHFVNQDIGYAVGGHSLTPTANIVLKTTDGGNSWSRAWAGSLMMTRCLNAVTFTSDQTGFAAGDGVISKTTDGAVHWSHTLLDGGGPGIDRKLYGLWFVDGSTGFAVGVDISDLTEAGGVILKTTDAGATWLPKQSGITQGLSAVRFVDALNGFAVGNAGVILRTTNGGETWNKAQRAGMGDRLNSLSFPSAQVGFSVGNNGDVFKTTDSGETWVKLSSGTKRNLNSVWFIDDQTGIAVGGFPGMGSAIALRTTNGGATWEEISLPSLNCLYSISIQGGQTAFVAGDLGTILKGDLTQIVSVPDGEAPGVATRLALLQNYPNPFNPTTTIKYELPKSSEVRLTVYDMLGREVSVLVDERRDAGVHEVRFDASGLSSGVYLYRLQAGSYVETRKLVLVR